MIKSIALQDSPREKAISQGIETLQDYEILALLLRTGNKEESVLELSQRLLDDIGGIAHLKDINYSTLLSVKGIKKAKAITLIASLELAKRVSQTKQTSMIYDRPHKIYSYIGERMKMYHQEHFVILILDHHHRLMKEKTLFIGSYNTSVVSIREIFVETLAINGTAIICIHNHPSGDPEPSLEDELFTEELFKSGKLMNVQVIDHIIIGWNTFYSFKAQKVLEGT